MYNLPARKTIFFSDKGLTPASAGHIANLAKEYYQRQERKLEGMSLTSKSIRLLSGESAQISRAISSDEFSQIPQLIDRIAKAKALIAWLREAIKAREALLELILSDGYIQSLEVEEAQDCVKPEAPVFVIDDGSSLAYDTEDNHQWWEIWWDYRRFDRDIKYCLDEDERIRYVFSQSVEDCLEDFIGVNGKFTKQVKMIDFVKSHPVEQRSYKGTAIYRDVCVSNELIAEVEYNLNQLTQKYKYTGEAEKIRRELWEREDQQRLEYYDALNAYEEQLEKIDRAKTQKAREIAQKVRNLRIIIPASLEPIYQEISSLGQD